MNDILTVSGLNKSYGDFSLKDVTFSWYSFRRRGILRRTFAR